MIANYLSQYDCKFYVPHNFNKKEHQQTFPNEGFFKLLFMDLFLSISWKKANWSLLYLVCVCVCVCVCECAQLCVTPQATAH